MESSEFRALSYQDAIYYVRGAVGIEQDNIELLVVLNALAILLSPIKTLVEIGVRNGGSICMFSRIMPKDSLIIGIDQDLDQVNVDEVRRLTSHLNVTFIDGNSRNPDIIERTRELLVGRTVDVLHIDGEHSVNAVQDDINIYRTLVSSPGAIIVHDIAASGDVISERLEYVWSLYRSICPHMEISLRDRSMGCGIIFI